MLGQTLPQNGLGVPAEGMSPDANDTTTGARVGALLAVFEKEIDSAVRPAHTAIAVAEFPRPTNAQAQPIQNGIEEPEVVDTSS